MNTASVVVAGREERSQRRGGGRGAVQAVFAPFAAAREGAPLVPRRVEITSVVRASVCQHQFSSQRGNKTI